MILYGILFSSLEVDATLQLCEPQIGENINVGMNFTDKSIIHTIENVYSLIRCVFFFRLFI